MVLAGLHWDICLVYIDDIIVMGSSFNEHVQNVAQVLQRLQSTGLKLKPTKCRTGNILRSCGFRLRH